MHKFIKCVSINFALLLSVSSSEVLAATTPNPEAELNEQAALRVSATDFAESLKGITGGDTSALPTKPHSALPRPAGQLSRKANGTVSSPLIPSTEDLLLNATLPPNAIQRYKKESVTRPGSSTSEELAPSSTTAEHPCTDAAAITSISSKEATTPPLTHLNLEAVQSGTTEPFLGEATLKTSSARARTPLEQVLALLRDNPNLIPTVLSEYGSSEAGTPFAPPSTKRRPVPFRSPNPFHPATPDGLASEAGSAFARRNSNNSAAAAPRRHSTATNFTRRNSMAVQEFMKRMSPSFVVGNSIPKPVVAETRPVITILSMKGGGIRGIGMAHFLAKVEEATQKPISSLFDYMIGTSAGGILATALSLPDASNSGKPRFSARDLEKMLYDEAKNIFDGRVRSAQGIAGPRYRDPIKVFNRILPDDPLFNEGLTKTMVTTYDYKDERLKLIANFPLTSEAENHQPHEVFSAVDAIRSTSAAPVYFKPHQCSPKEKIPDGAHNYITQYTLGDGGVCANNPGLVGLNEVMRRHPGSPILMVSVGTGRKNKVTTYQELASAGMFDWLKMGLIDRLMSAPMHVVEEQLISAFMPYNPEELESPAAMVDGQFFQFEPSIEDDSMDNTSRKNLDALVQSMKNEISKPGSLWPELIKALKRHKASHPDTDGSESENT